MSVVEALTRGEVVLLDTDTIPGLHGLATAPDIVNKMIELKGTVPGRGFLLLFFDADEVFRYASAASEDAEARVRSIWPGPLTAVLQAKPDAPDTWSSDAGTVAARVPSLPILRDLLQIVGAPLFSTSANRAGQSPSRTLADAREQFPMLISSPVSIDGEDRPSTVVDFTVHPPRLLREGALAWPPA